MINRPRKTFWLIDSTTNIYVCNNYKLIIEFYNKLIQIGGFILDEILPNQRKI